MPNDAMNKVAMNYKNVAVLIIIIIVLLGGGFSLYYYRDAILSKGQRSGQEEQNSKEIKDQKISDSAKPFKIEITYPQIAGLDAFNQKVQSEINTRLEEFKKNSLENDEAVKKVDPQSYAKYPREYDFNATYDKGEVDDNVASVVLNIYAFEGGAHGGEIFSPVNWDVKNNKEIKLADLFPNQPDFLQKISEFCIDDLKNQISTRMEDNGEWLKENETWLNEGAGPNGENFSVFLINKDSIVFYFSEYQVAPYAAGNFKVAMPR